MVCLSSGHTALGAAGSTAALGMYVCVCGCSCVCVWPCEPPEWGRRRGKKEAAASLVCANESPLPASEQEGASHGVPPRRRLEIPCSGILSQSNLKLWSDLVANPNLWHLCNLVKVKEERIN